MNSMEREGFHQMKGKDIFAVILILALLCPLGLPPETAYAADTKRSETSSCTVKKGDNLWKLSGQYYGKGSYYTEIYRANQAAIGNNPDLIFPGMVFELPVITKNSGTKADTGSGENGSSGSGGNSSAGSDTVAAGAKNTDAKDTNSKDPGAKDTNVKNTDAKDPGAKDTGTKDTGAKDAGSTGPAGKSSGQAGTDRSGEEDLIRDFLIRYYGALAAGDAGYCLDLYDTISAEDRKLLEAIASYFDQFENLTCRALDGPVKGSYVAFVDCEAVSLKDGHRLDHMEAFYLVPDSKKQFRIASPDQYFEDVRKNQTP